MKEKEIQLFKKYLLKITNYLEFGSGGSTYYAINNNVTNIITIETDIKWIHKLNKEKLIIDKKKKDELKIIFIDINCIWWEHVSWGINEPPPDGNNWHNYSKSINNCHFIPDLILIDGRFRVASALECIQIMNDNTYLLIHDYTLRPQYHIIEQFFDKVECVDTLQVFKKKKKILTEELQNIIEKYRLIMD